MTLSPVDWRGRRHWFATDAVASLGPDETPELNDHRDNDNQLTTTRDPRRRNPTPAWPRSFSSSAWGRCRNPLAHGPVGDKEASQGARRVSLFRPVQGSGLPMSKCALFQRSRARVRPARLDDGGLLKLIDPF